MANPPLHPGQPKPRFFWLALTAVILAMVAMVILLSKTATPAILYKAF